MIAAEPRRSVASQRIPPPTKRQIAWQANEILFEAATLRSAAAARRLQATLAALAPAAQDDLVQLLVARSTAPVDRYATGSLSQILRHTQAEMLLPDALGRLFERGRLVGEQISRIFGRLCSTQAGMDAAPDPRAAARALKGCSSTPLRAQVALVLLSEARAPMPLEGRGHYYQAVCELIEQDLFVCQRVVEELAADPQNVWDAYMALDAAAIALWQDRLRALRGREPLLDARLDEIEKIFHLEQTTVRLWAAVEPRARLLASHGRLPASLRPSSLASTLKTVIYPPNRESIAELAERYGLSAALLAGMVAAEMDFGEGFADPGVDHQRVDNKPSAAGAVGLRREGLRRAIEYLRREHLRGADAAQNYDASPVHRATFLGSVEAVAIVAAMLVHVHFVVATAADMAVVWAAFRRGVDGLTRTQGGGYLSPQDFADHRAADVDGLPAELQMGSEAYLAIPHMEYFRDFFA